jgi:hypothetical protein
MTDKPRRLTLDDLQKFVAKLPPEIRADDGGRTAVLANTIIAHFLGKDWFAKHIRHDAQKLGFLNYDFSSDRRREASTFRVIELAENLLNLQHLDGFDDCIGQLIAGGDKIESTCAELDFGRFLYIHDVDFRFVVATLIKGKDYDFELLYRDGRSIPADAKCKLESTKINPTTLSNTLEKARKQLPSDRPGVIFLKVPQAWTDDVAVAVAMVEEGRRFLRNTDRVISIKFYVSHLETRDGIVHHRHAYREITNQKSRFYDGKNWDLFTGYVVPASWNGMPPKWHRLFFFPASAPSP